MLLGMRRPHCTKKFCLCEFILLLRAYYILQRIAVTGEFFEITRALRRQLDVIPIAMGYNMVILY